MDNKKIKNKIIIKIMIKFIIELRTWLRLDIFE